MPSLSGLPALRTAWRCAVISLAVLVLPAGWAVPAEAAVPRIRIPAVRNLPKLRVQVPRPATIGLNGLSRSGRYGVIDVATIAALDDAGRGLADDVDTAATQVGANADARVALRECTGDGLEGAGTSYAEALRDAAAAGTVTPAPDFAQVTDGTAACLQSHFRDAPEEMFEMGKHLASLAAERAQEAYTAAPSGAVLAEWMTTTGPELTETEIESEATVDETTGTDGPIGDTGSDPPPGEGFPWWAAIAALVVLGGGAALVRSKKS